VSAYKHFENFPAATVMEFNRVMATRIHPTKSLLISTTIEILDEKLPGEIAVDEILEKSGISKGTFRSCSG
jgi:AcrR family transcriptional regulator